MADIPLVQIPYPEEETRTLYGYITNDNAPPKYDDIMDSNLTKEQKVKAIQDRTNAYKSDVDRQLHKDYARMGAGTALSMASALPLRFLPSWAGAAAGGAMYDLGQGIVEGDTAPDLLKRTTRGALVGGTIGLVPYAANTPLGKMVAESKPGQAVGSALNKVGEKFANTKLYDALMTDIKGFNPFKQTVYHGSPYDFNKFSNEAIGTGEGAQAHGYGHYTALDKDVADVNYRQRLNSDESKWKIDRDKSTINGIPISKSPFKDVSEQGIYNLDANRKRGVTFDVMVDDLNKRIEHFTNQYEKFKNTNKGRAKQYLKRIENDIKDYEILKNHQYDFVNDDFYPDLKRINPQGQLYKLSIPKDDVMLREGATFAEQPKKVQDILKREYFDKINENLPLKHQKTPEQILEMYGGNDFDNLRRFLINKTGLEGQELTNLLNSHGIKGISYNGGIDGEARVIFNPEDIEIIRKYYNQPGLFEQLTGASNSGAAVDSLYNKIAR